MATKVKGITIELSADTTGIEKALKDVNKELNSTQKQLNSVNKSLKLDPGNMDLIEQKQRLLAKATEETTKKLQALKQAQDAIANQGGEGSQAQYDALTREISDTQQKLTSLNKEQQAFSGYAAQAQASSTAFGQGLSAVGTAAMQVSEKTQAMSMAATAALGGMVALAVKAGQQADEWATMSQQLGLSTETLQKFQYASERIDVGMNDITSAITRMTSSLSTSKDVYDQIGVKIEGQNGQLRDTEDIFWDVVKALGDIKNETERDAMSMKIFGRNAKELSGLIDDGGKKMRALGDEAESMGLIVSDEDIQKLNEFNDLLDGMKTMIQAALVEVAIPVVEALQPLVAGLANAVKMVAQALSNMNPVIVKIAGVVLMIIAAISPIAGLIGRISFALLGLTQAIPMAITGLEMLNGAFASLAANPVVGTVVAIIAILAALGIAIYEVVKHWDEIKSGAASAFNGVKEHVTKTISNISNFAQLVKVAAGAIPAVVNKIGDAFGAVAQKIASVVINIVTSFSNLASKAREAGSKVMKSFTSGIESAINSVTNAIQRLARSISNIWQSMAMDASSAGSNVGRSFSNAYNSSMNNLRTPSMTGSSYGGRGGSNYTTSSNGSVANAISSLADAISRQNSAPTNVNVELVGSAKNIFDTVRVQNTKMVTATGYHALA